MFKPQACSTKMILDPAGCLSFGCNSELKIIKISTGQNWVDNFCASRGVDLLQCPKFKRVRGKLDTSLFAIDGIHPSRHGVKALFNSFVKHIKLVNKWGDLDKLNI